MQCIVKPADGLTGHSTAGWCAAPAERLAISALSIHLCLQMHEDGDFNKPRGAILKVGSDSPELRLALE